MPRSLVGILKVWHLLVAVVLQSGGLIGAGIWWTATTDAEIKVIKRDITTASLKVERIDNEGSRVWANRHQSDQKASEKTDARLNNIEDKFNSMNLKLERLITLSEQNQRLLKGN